jgi:hypothetical protein
MLHVQRVVRLLFIVILHAVATVVVSDFSHEQHFSCTFTVRPQHAGSGSPSHLPMRSMYQL